MDVNPALEPVAVNHTPGEEYSAATREWQGIPGIERTADGTLWATWYSGGGGEGPFNYVLLTHSTDDGERWSDPDLVVDPPGVVRAFDPCLWVDPLDRLWLFWAQEYAKWDGRAGVWAIMTPDPTTEDAWSEPRRLCDGIMMNKPTVIADDEWLFPATRWDRPIGAYSHLDKSGVTLEDIRKYTDPVDVGRTPTTVWASTDYGQSVTQRGGAQVPNGVQSPDEQMIVQLKDGRLWMLIRTTYGIGESFSSDGGRTWTPVRESGLEHPETRFFIRRLASGTLLLVKHADPGNRTDLSAYVSTDDGASWSGGLLLDGRDSVSYPDGFEGPDGTIYVTYDRERHGATEILLATFDEDAAATGEGEVRRSIIDKIE